MTEVNGISPCSSLAFVGGTDRIGGRGGERGKWNMSRKRPGKPRDSAEDEGELSRKRSATNWSFLLIECLILLMMGFIKSLRKEKNLVSSA